MVSPRRTGRTTSHGGTTRGHYPRACAAIRAGRYKVEAITGSKRPATVVSRRLRLSGGRVGGWVVCHDTSTPGQALAWIQEQETAIAAARQAAVAS